MLPGRSTTPISQSGPLHAFLTAPTPRASGISLQGGQTPKNGLGGGLPSGQVGGHVVRVPHNQEPGKVIPPEAVAFPLEPFTPRRQASYQVRNALPLHREPALMAGKGIIPALQRPAPGREVLKSEGRLLPVVVDDDGVLRLHFLSLSRARVRVRTCVYFFSKNVPKGLTHSFFNVNMGTFICTHSVPIRKQCIDC